MVSLWNGYQTWTMQSVLSDRVQDRKVRQLNAALSAEDIVSTVLEEAGFPTFLRKRVFVAQDNHNREIDVVAITDRILVIEVKNWTGSVWRNGHRWFQLPYKAQRPLEFEDIFSEATYKADALRRHLENDHKIFMQAEAAVVPILIFTHPLVKLDPNTVKNIPGVYSLQSFKQYIETVRPTGGIVNKKQSWGSWLVSFVPRFGAKDLLTRETCDQIEHALSKVRTWDTVVLHNGTMMHGDVVAVECPSACCAYQRYHLSGIKLTWSKPNAVGLLTSLWAGTAGQVELELVEAKKQAKKKEARPRNARGNIEFPILVEKRKEEMRNIDRVVVKRAGSASMEPIPLSTIRSIELSQHLCATPILGS